jgi:hypothetical protein
MFVLSSTTLELLVKVVCFARQDGGLHNPHQGIKSMGAPPPSPLLILVHLCMTSLRKLHQQHHS